MVTHSHEVPIRLFQARPDLAAGLAMQLLSDEAYNVLEEYMSMTYQDYLESPAGKLELKGERRGEQRGRRLGQIGALLKVLDARGIEVSASALARIEGVSDEEELDRWFIRAVTVDRVEEIFD
jgi:hypothetical protein